MSEAKKKQKNAMFSGRLQKSAGKLIYTAGIQEKQYKEFVDVLEEGQIVEVFFDANKDTGTLAQLAKIHKCVREIANEMGDTVEDVKFLVKYKSGFCIIKVIDGREFMHCKSFGDCSVEDLGLAIQTIIEMGDHLNINFR